MKRSHSLEFFKSHENSPEKSNSNNSLEYKFKIILLGDSSVGKTSLLYQYITHSFTDQNKPTSGVYFNEKKVLIDISKHSFFSTCSSFHDQICFWLNLQIWDTAGDEKYRSITGHYFKGSQVAIIAIDLTRTSSLDSLNFWLSEVINKNDDELILCVVGNKLDLKDEILINKEDVLKKFPNLEINYFETSAKSGKNVEKTFEFIIEELIKKIGESMNYIDSLQDLKENNCKNIDGFIQRKKETMVLKLDTTLTNKLMEKNTCC